MTQDRWAALMRASTLPPCTDCYHSLCDAYAETHRFYHTGKHISAMLAHFDAVRHLAERPAELELAIWFHDAVYRILSETNELDSAEWARAFLLSQGFNTAGAERVHALIMATLHNGTVQGNDAQLLADIDLAVLGAPAHVFDAFEQNVRKEYKIVPAFIYRRQRKKILRSFLQQKRIYRFEYFRNRYEQTARDNIQKAMNCL